jgi:hypothetical protein
MDPLTLFALANGAVAAVKKGCALYKEIQGAASDVKGVLQDLDEQFKHRYKDKPPTVAEKNQYIQEKNRIIELSKKQPDDIFTEIGEHLGQYFENMATCLAIFEEEERHATDVYTGTVSIGKRALQRVLMRSRLEAMQKELREIMVYQCPPELGDLYTRVEKMMIQIQQEQSIAIKNKMKRERQAKKSYLLKQERFRKRIWWWGTRVGITITTVLYLIALTWSVIELRKVERPDLGVCLLPKGTWPYEHYNNLKWVECDPKKKEAK